MLYFQGNTPKLWTIRAVSIPTVMNVITATSEVVDNDAKPLMPCPDVHPFESLVPKPTRKPPIASLHHSTDVVKNPSVAKVIVYMKAPKITPMAKVSRHPLELRYCFCRKYGLFEKKDIVVSKKLLWVAWSPVAM